MTLINNAIDNLIMNIRSTGSVDDIKFVKAYRTANVRKPQGDLCAVVNLREVEPSRRFLSGLCYNGLRGELYNATLNLRIYSEGAGDQLTRAALRLSDAVRKADSEGIVSDVKIYPIGYDSACCEVYRDVNAKLDFLLCEDEYDDNN